MEQICLKKYLFVLLDSPIIEDDNINYKIHLVLNFLQILFFFSREVYFQVF